MPFDEVVETWGGRETPAEAAISLVLTMIQQEGLATVRRVAEENDEGEERERFVIDVDRTIRPYREVKDVEDYVARRPEPGPSPFGQLGGGVTLGAWNPTTILATGGTFTTGGTTRVAIPNYPQATHLGAPYIFIVMPFRPTWSQNVADVVSQACTQVRDERYEDLTWERADEMTDTGRITDQITAAIERADLIIADITDGNANVMFELGYASALGRRSSSSTSGSKTRPSTFTTGGRLLAG